MQDRLCRHAKPKLFVLLFMFVTIEFLFGLDTLRAIRLDGAVIFEVESIAVPE